MIFCLGIYLNVHYARINYFYNFKSLNFNILVHTNKLLVLVKIKILLTILKIFLYTIRTAIFCRVEIY